MVNDRVAVELFDWSIEPRYCSQRPAGNNNLLRRSNGVHIEISNSLLTILVTSIVSLNCGGGSQSHGPIKDE